MSKTLTVELGGRSYPIIIGSGLLSDPANFRDHIRARQVVVVTNETVGPLYLETLRQGLVDFEVSSVVLPDGEAFKTLNQWRRILDALLQKRCARDTTLIALGGGVIGDIAGFAAACYQRGIALLQVPTTLLAQVDSSVGGKTAVNHPDGKNMIGAFHQPVAVVADLSTFATLAQRELSAGLAEVLKYGFIRDPAFLDWLEFHMVELLARDPEAMAYAVYRSCEMKAAVVAEDELETGLRALLNFGHTFGHAIETASGYGTYLHGEAVAIGACMAAELSARLGWLEAADVERVCHLFASAGLPTTISKSLGTDELLQLMSVDKKVLDGQLRLVLLRGIGHAVVQGNVDPECLRQAIDARRH